MSLTRVNTRWFCDVKGTVCSFGEDIFNFYITKYLFFQSLDRQAVLRGKIRSPDHCVKLERWQGPPNINSRKLCRPLSSVCLFSYENKESLFRLNEDLCLLIKMSSTKLHSAPLKLIQIQTFRDIASIHFSGQNIQTYHTQMIIWCF